MYLLIDNKPYAIRNNKVYKVKFGDRGTIEIGEEVEAQIEGKIYTYDEIKRKFNLNAMLQAKNEPTKELVDELNKQISALTKENNELKKKLEGDKPKVEEIKKEVVEEVKDDDKKKKNK